MGIRPWLHWRTLCWIVALISQVTAQPVTVDPNFAPQLLADEPVTSDLQFTPVSDGRLVVMGDFTHSQGMAAARRVRLKADGTPDPTFSIPSEPVSRPLVALRDGRMIAFAGSPPKLQRLLPDGAIDSSFVPIEVSGDYGLEVKFALLPDGRVFIAGRFSTIGAFDRTNLARLNADGSFDPTFNPAIDPGTVDQFAVQADGKVVFSRALPPDVNGVRRFTIDRLNADGSEDSSFQFAGEPSTDANSTSRDPSEPYTALAVQADGKVLAATGHRLHRYNVDGSHDAGFLAGIPGLRSTSQIIVLSPGEIVVESTLSPATPAGSLVPPSVFVLDGQGSVVRDLRTSLPADVAVELLAVQSDHRLVVRYGRPFYHSTQQVEMIVRLACPVIARVDLSGIRDEAFAPAFTRTSSPAVEALHTDAAGNLLVSGDFTSIDGTARPGIARIRPDGRLDATFSPDLHSGADPFVDVWYLRPAKVVAVYPDGAVLVRGLLLGEKNSDGVHVAGFGLRRLLPDGSRDTRFAGANLPGDAEFHALDADGGLWLSHYGWTGVEPEQKLVRASANAAELTTLPTSFSGFMQGRDHWSGWLPSQILAVQPQSDGKVLVHPTVSHVNGATIRGIVRLNPDGTTDTTYTPDVAPSRASRWPDVVFLAGGRALYTPYPDYGEPAATTVRLLADGSRDPSFTPLDGANVAASIELPDGKLLGGAGNRRWLANGLEDLEYRVSFGTTYWQGAAAFGEYIYVVRDFTEVNGEPRSAIARLVSAETAAFTVQPVGESTVAGREVVLQGAFGQSAATYQWTHNGSPIAGATTRVLVLSPVRVADAGGYRLVATFAEQTYTSELATLTVAANTARLTNFSARSRVSPDLPPQIGGFVLRGGSSRQVLLRAVGRGLPVQDPGFPLLSEPQLRLQREGTFVATDAGGARAAEIVPVAARLGAFPAGATSWNGQPAHDSALLLSLAPGIYTAQTSSGDGTPGVSLFELYDAAAGASGAFAVNVSIRGNAAPGGDVLIGGFVIDGTGPLLVLLRGIGPSLNRAEVPAAVADPRITLYQEQELLATNDNWSERSDKDDIVAAAQRVGAFALPAGSRDAALLVRLEPGVYTVHGAGVDDSSGEMLIELYIVEE